MEGCDTVTVYQDRQHSGSFTPSSLNTTPSKKHGFLQNSTKFRKLVTGFESRGSRIVSGGRGVDSNLESPGAPLHARGCYINCFSFFYFLPGHILFSQKGLS